MQSINKISKCDYYSILNWSEPGVPYVEKPTDVWFDYVSQSSKVICLCLHQDKEIKAYCQADIINKSASISVVTNPKALRNGFATRLLTELQVVLKSKKVEKMEASVEVKNKASSLLAEKLGFSMAEQKNSEPGFVQYTKLI